MLSMLVFIYLGLSHSLFHSCSLWALLKVSRRLGMPQPGLAAWGSLTDTVTPTTIGSKTHPDLLFERTCSFWQQHIGEMVLLVRSWIHHLVCNRPNTKSGTVHSEHILCEFLNAVTPLLHPTLVCASLFSVSLPSSQRTAPSQGFSKIIDWCRSLLQLLNRPEEIEGEKGGHGCQFFLLSFF